MGRKTSRSYIFLPLSSNRAGVLDDVLLNYDITKISDRIIETLERQKAIAILIGMYGCESGWITVESRPVGVDVTGIENLHSDSGETWKRAV
jgi:hypothetical protein